MAKRKRRRGGRQNKMQLMLLILVLALVAGIIITGQIFTLKDVQVIGNSNYSANDIARMAQLPFGENIFKVDIENIGKNFLGSGYVEFLNARRVLPNTVELTVRERTPRAMINYLGVTLIIDEKGYIMEQRSDVPDMDILIVTGVKLSSFQVGLKVTSSVPNQIESMSALLTEVYKMGLSDTLSELNVADLDNMYGMTRTGMMVIIGDQDNLPAKLALMQGTLEIQIAEGKLTGVIDVAGGKSAVYTAP